MVVKGEGNKIGPIESNFQTGSPPEIRGFVSLDVHQSSIQRWNLIER